MKKYIGYLGYILAIIAGARGVTGLVIVFIALGMTLFFGSNRRKVDLGRPSAGKQNPFLDGVYFFFIQLLIVFVAYLIGIFAASSAGEMFGMFLSGQRAGPAG